MLITRRKIETGHVEVSLNIDEFMNVLEELYATNSDRKVKFESAKKVILSMRDYIPVATLLKFNVAEVNGSSVTVKLKSATEKMYNFHKHEK